MTQRHVFIYCRLSRMSVVSWHQREVAIDRAFFRPYHNLSALKLCACSDVPRLLGMSYKILCSARRVVRKLFMDCHCV
jgi:hypothetical protein